MFKMIRINKKIEVLLILLFLTFNIFTLISFTDSLVNIEDSDEVSENMTYDFELPHSSSTIESTTTTKRTTPSNNFVVNMPSYRPDGDLYIAQIAMDEDQPYSSVPSGWTEIENGIALHPGPDVRLATYWKIGSSEPATYTWSCAAARVWIGAIYRITSFDSNNPIHASAISTLSSPGSANPTAPSVTTTTENCLILRMFGADGDNTTSTYWPSGTSPLFQDDCGFDSVMSAAAHHNQSATGSTGNAQFTMSGVDIWVAISIAITPEQVPPTFSNLIESADPLELGETEKIRINVSDPSGINQTLIEFGGLNHSMTRIGGDTWEYDDWKPGNIGIRPYTIWIEDNYGNWNSTSDSITVVDTTAPIYSDLIESADPLQLGQNETISIKIFDSPGTGVNQTLLEYESANHTMINTVGNTWSWTNWKPSIAGTYPYKIHMQDMQNNWNVTNTHNITVIAGTAPSIENLTESANPLELGNNVTISVDVSDVESSVSGVLIELEGANYTMTNTVGNTYEYNWTRSWVGIVIFTIYANDTENNWNKLTDSFDIVDTTEPTLTALTESQELLELGNSVIISVNATDLTGIGHAKISYEGGNHTMSNNGDTWSCDPWTPLSTGNYFYTIWIEDNNNNWNSTSGDITVQDTTSPVFLNLIENSDPIELGAILIITITISDLSDIKGVSIEYEGTNHSMENIGGDLWQYDEWSPTVADNYSYIIHMEDNNNNYNFTTDSIIFQDTTIPIYSNLDENADPLELGSQAEISIEITDFAGIYEVLIEFEGLNHTMDNIGGSDVYEYTSWIPSNWTLYQYEIHMEDNSGNKNVASGNITVQDTTPPSQPIFTNAPSGDVSGVLTFDWIDGSDPSGISYYVLMIDNESNPYATPGYVFISNITNIGSESSYYELLEALPSGSYYYFLIQIDGVGHQSSYTTGTFTIISNDNGNDEFMLFLIIGIVFGSIIASVTAIVVVKRKLQKGSLPSRKKIPLKIVISHIENLIKSAQISEKPKKQKIKKPKEKVKAAQQKDSINGEELTARINKIKSYGEKLFTEGAYLEAQKQFEFAEKILLKLGKNEEALIFSNLKIGIKELREERRKKLELLEEEKLEGDSLKIFDLYYDLIELSEKLKDYGSVDMYLSELTHFYQTEQIKLRDLEYQRFKLYKQANSLIEEKNFEQSVELYEKCEKISQFLVQIGRENEKNNVKKFREKIEECLSKAAQK